MGSTTEQACDHGLAQPSFPRCRLFHALSSRLPRRRRNQSGRLGRGSPVFGLLVPVCCLAAAATAGASSPVGPVVSQSGNYIVEYDTVPSPIPTNRMFEMTVSVRERLKKSLARNVTLEVDAGMPAHNHGMNTMPVVERLPSRQFRVRGMLFHMRGEWKLVFSIKRGIMVDKAEQILEIRR